MGFRGFPGVEGGIETHAEHLYPLLVERGCSIEVITRKRYVEKYGLRTYRGVCLTPLWGPRGKGIEAGYYSFISVIAAAVKRPDLVHIHGIGPALMTPLARLLGIPVVVTHHGHDYDAEKWGLFARLVLRVGEWIGMRFANQRIVVSEGLGKYVERKYGLSATTIRNGVEVSDPPSTTTTLSKLGLTRGRYIIEVARVTPHKRQEELVRAFSRARLNGWKLVLVGSVQPLDEYARLLCSLVESTPNVILAGFRTGQELRELYANAGLFVLPSAYEGMPIAVLEALSYGLPVVLSDIPAHLELGLPRAHYFPTGDISALTDRLNEFASLATDEDLRRRMRAAVVEKHDWDRIAEQTHGVYSSVRGSSRKSKRRNR